MNFEYSVVNSFCIWEFPKNYNSAVEAAMIVPAVVLV